MNGSSAILTAVATASCVGLTALFGSAATSKVQEAQVPVDGKLLEAKIDVLSARIAEIEERLVRLERRTKYETHVLASEEWQVVVPRVRAGDRIEIEASGTWKFGPSYEPVGPDGATGGPIAYNEYEGFHHGALVTTLDPVAAVDPFATKNVIAPGERSVTVVPAGYDGPLFMRINDSDTSNNVGYLYVAVTVHRLPSR